MVINGYFINGYEFLLYLWLLNGYWWLSMIILLIAINNYSIGGY